MNSLKMQDTIQRFMLQTFSKAQQFLIELLCGILLLLNILGALILQDNNRLVFIVQDYYDQKLEKDCQQINSLRVDNEKLRKSMKSMKSQISVLQYEKARLNTKLQNANNMLRILTKTREDVNSCKTPVKINPSGVDRLLRKKLNETCTTKNSNNKQHHVIRPLPPVTVVQKKEVKKIAPPKGKENVSCVQRKLRRSLSEQKEVSNVTRKMKPNILLNNPPPKKSVILFKGKENLGASSNKITIGSKLKETTNIRKETVSVGNQASKTCLRKRVEPKNANLKPRKNLNETFDVIKEVEPY